MILDYVFILKIINNLFFYLKTDFFKSELFIICNNYLKFDLKFINLKVYYGNIKQLLNETELDLEYNTWDLDKILPLANKFDIIFCF